MKNNLINLEVIKLFEEYSNKNLTLVILEENKSKIERAFIKARIQNKQITKNLSFKNQGLNTITFNEKLIVDIKKT